MTYKKLYSISKKLQFHLPLVLVDNNNYTKKGWIIYLVIEIIFKYKERFHRRLWKLTQLTHLMFRNSTNDSWENNASKSITVRYVLKSVAIIGPVFFENEVFDTLTAKGECYRDIKIQFFVPWGRVVSAGWCHLPSRI